MKKYELKFNSILSVKHKSDYFPEYVFESDDIKIGRFCRFYYQFLLIIFKFFLKWRLKILGHSYREYKEKTLGNKDIENIYTREAKTYEYKHHLTTNFRDTWWRRQIGLEVINYIFTNKKNEEKIKLLDIGTGVGLSLEEMFKMFKLFNVKASAIGLDYNQKMLDQANQITLHRMLKEELLKDDYREVRFTRGDARNLTEKNGRENLEYFSRDSFDCLTIMFGIGGIDFQLKSMKEQLAVLKPNGILALTDIHRPIVKLKEKWPWFIGRKNANAFTIMAWEKVTKPLVLASLWGWRDPTSIFYLAPLVVDYDKDRNIHYGFKQLSFFLNNEFWWFNLPVIPTAKIVLKKIEISKDEFGKRQQTLSIIPF